MTYRECRWPLGQTPGTGYRRVVYRFLLTPRWLGLAVVAVVLAGVGLQLGSWQFDRRDERISGNARVEANLSAPVTSLASLGLTDTDMVDDGSQWRAVTVTGSYDDDGQLIVRNQSRDEGPGVGVLTPLRSEDGSAVLVERGWVGTSAGAIGVADVQPPPDGQVTVTGWLRADSAADSTATEPVDGTVRAVASDRIAESLGYPLLPGYVALIDQVPAPDGDLVGPERPDLGQGPHFFYGLQWWFFGLLAPVGYAWFAYVEAHPRSRDRRSQPVAPERART